MGAIFSRRNRDDPQSRDNQEPEQPTEEIPLGLLQPPSGLGGFLRQTSDVSSRTTQSTTLTALSTGTPSQPTGAVGEIDEGNENVPDTNSATPRLDDQNRPRDDQAVATPLEVKCAAFKRIINSIINFYLNHLTMLIFFHFILIVVLVANQDFKSVLKDRAVHYDIGFNVVRPKCVYEMNNKTYHKTCLPDKVIPLLNENIVNHYCRPALRDAFIEICQLNDTTREIDNLPVIDKWRFHGQLAKNLTKFPLQGITADNLYDLCLRVFQYNPFGDVEVIEKKNKLEPTHNESSQEFTQHSFVYRNRQLMMSKCPVSSSISHVFAELPSCFDRLREFTQVIGISMCVAVAVRMISFLFFTMEDFNATPPSSPVPGDMA